MYMYRSASPLSSHHGSIGRVSVRNLTIVSAACVAALLGVFVGALAFFSVPHAAAASSRDQLRLTNGADLIRSTPKGWAGTFLGSVGDDGLSVAVVVRPNREVTVYLCNAAGVSQWFRGTATRNSVDLAANGFRIRANLSGSKATGRVTLPDGSSRAFRATGAAKGSGLWRATGVLGTSPVTVGWIVLDGRLSGFGFGGSFGSAQCFPQFGFNPCQTGFGGGGGGGFGGFGGGGFGAIDGAPNPGPSDPAPEFGIVDGALAIRLTIGEQSATFVGAPLNSRTA